MPEKTFDFSAAAKEFAPTDEQQAIIDAFGTGENLVIEAGAGSGKTSTLRMLGKADSRRTGVYLAYNKAIADDAKASFPPNVRCSTAHSLAFRAVGKNYVTRLNGPRLPARVVAHRLGISDPVDLSADKVLSPIQLARIAMEAVTSFCHSAEPHVRFWHVPKINGLTGNENYELHAAILPLADLAWQDIIDPEGTLKFEHDHYLKIWGLQDPMLPCDYVLLDEAQDANPVLAQIVERQKHAQRILVGDASQAIYGWRGATNAMDDFDGERLQLSQSFRFGPAIAEEANKWLTYLGATLRLRGFDPVESRIDSLEAPDAILCRTNAGAVGAAIQEHTAGRRAALVGGGGQIRSLATAAQDLIAGNKTEHPELFMFDSWAEVHEYTQQDASGSDLRVFVKLIDDMGPPAVIQAIDNLVDERGADVVVSTAHKSKGREWGTVRIHGDFYQPKEEGQKISKEEAMLAYVSVTRAKIVLDRSGLSFIDALLEDSA